MINYKMTFGDKVKFKFYYSKLAEWCIPGNWKYLFKELFCRHDYKVGIMGVKGCKKCGKTKAS